MKKQFYSLICSLLLLPGAIAFAAATANKVDLSALSAMTSAELQTYLLALPEADFVKTMQALVASPQLELRTRSLAAARNVINRMPIAKRSQVAESLQSVCPDLRVSINATGEASFYTLPNNRRSVGRRPRPNENLSQPPATP
ncbi:MAG: hypothetical protein GX937_05965 [Lentisphaerae bacterium]|jgi:hypothetical protein|nr:hypothetical protein [Lentisphaerota bacterium]